MLRLYMYLLLISLQSHASEHSRVLRKKHKKKRTVKNTTIQSDCDKLKMPHLGELRVMNRNGEQYQYINRTNNDRFIVFMQVYD